MDSGVIALISASTALVASVAGPIVTLTVARREFNATAGCLRPRANRTSASAPPNTTRTNPATSFRPFFPARSVRVVAADTRSYRSARREPVSAHA